ncbi:MAG: hypothetical protein O3B82_02900 [Bacteroidetes bacterium]|nr:hypothetical protein [Bacteroidota bacterium]
MESKRTPLLEALNSLAMIHHASGIDPNASPNSELLEEIKSLAARLYMEVDIELISRQYSLNVESDVLGASEEKLPPSIESPINAFVQDLSESKVDGISTLQGDVLLEPEIEVVIESTVESEVQSPDDLTLETEKPHALEPTLEANLEVQSEHKLSASPNKDTSEITPPIVKSAETEFSKPNNTVPMDIAPSLFPFEPLSNTSNESNTGSAKTDSNSVIAQFPLSRRFEFCNILFGGDMKIMGSCIQEIIDAPDEAGRLEVYGRWYDQKQWRRRDESAGDMHKMIKRILNN